GLSLASLFAFLVPITIASARSDSALVLRPTKVVVQCAPRAVTPEKTSECLVTVSDNAAGKKEAPVGAVTLSTSGPGAVDVPTCTLAPAVTASRCTVHYTPSGIGKSGLHVITASYPGSEIHAQSANRAAVLVTPPNDDRRAAERLAPPPSAI